MTPQSLTPSEVARPDTPASFATSFPPEAELVAAVRRFVSDFYARVLGDSDSSSRVALATHELLENAIAHCTHGDVTIRVSVSPFLGSHLVRVRTRNAATQADIAKVERIIGQLEAARDPALFYQQRMLQAVRETEGSGLGLARIYAEGGMEMSCTIKRDEIEIAAQATLGKS